MTIPPGSQGHRNRRCPQSPSPDVRPGTCRKLIVFVATRQLFRYENIVLIYDQNIDAFSPCQARKSAPCAHATNALQPVVRRQDKRKRKKAGITSVPEVLA